MFLKDHIVSRILNDISIALNYRLSDTDFIEMILAIPLFFFVVVAQFIFSRALLFKLSF